MFSMLHNVNKTLRGMADAILNMNRSLKRLYPSNTDDQLDPKRRKYSSKDGISASDASDNYGDDSQMELQAFCGTEAGKRSKDKPPARLEQSFGGNDPLLWEIAPDLLNADESGPPAEKQMADFINDTWSKKLPDSKLKGKWMKYSRPANCEILETPRLFREIWEKLSHSVKQQEPRSSSTQKTVGRAGAVVCKSVELLLEMKNSKQLKSDSDIQKLIKFNTDAVALLAHVHVHLPYRRRESIKPQLNKDYAGPVCFASSRYSSAARQRPANPTE